MAAGVERWESNQQPVLSFEASFLKWVLCANAALAESIWMQSHSKIPYLVLVWTWHIVSAYKSNKDSLTPANPCKSLLSV